MQDGGISLPSEATASAAGYYYQVRYALLRSLKAARKAPTASVSIEKLDDVAVEYSDGSIDHEQLKHSLLPDAKIGDFDHAFWRTIGNWSRLLASADLDGKAPRLFLISTGEAKAGSILSQLEADRQASQETNALEQARLTAATSSNKGTAGDRADFLALPEEIQRSLIRSITFIGQQPGLSALGSEIEEALHFACGADSLKDFRLELEGWWFDRVMRSWTKGGGATIGLMEVDSRIGYLREKFKLSELLCDVDEPEALEPLDDRTFVKQVKILNVKQARVTNAQRDYLKASAQRSKWLRQLQIVPEELHKYDRDLAERLLTRAAIAHDELADDADDETKRKCGRELLAWAELQEHPLRNAKAQFLTSGSYHMLADELKVGWHPEYDVLCK